MTGHEYGRLAYLGLLALALILWFFFRDRTRMGLKLQYLGVWALICGPLTLSSPFNYNGVRILRHAVRRA